MKNIAVITGASSGMGKQFAETLSEYGTTFDELWVIARRLEKLTCLKAPCPVRPIALDLSDRSSFETYRALLVQEQPRVALLIHCSGFGKFQAVMDTSLEENLNMVDLNCQAALAMCQLTIPYMAAGGRIAMISSVAAFQPIPYVNVYGATKAFVLSFSRALHRELRGRGISVTAVCPFWTKTAFFDRAVEQQEHPVVKKYVAMYRPEQIVARAWRDIKRGKDVSQFGFIARTQTFLTKLCPHSFVMWFWQKQQGL